MQGILFTFKKKDAYQVHKYRNDALKRGCVLSQCNVEVLNEVFRRAGLENNNKNQLN